MNELPVRKRKNVFDEYFIPMRHCNERAVTAIETVLLLRRTVEICMYMHLTNRMRIVYYSHNYTINIKTFDFVDNLVIEYDNVKYDEYIYHARLMFCLSMKMTLL